MVIWMSGPNLFTLRHTNDLRFILLPNNMLSPAFISPKNTRALFILKAGIHRVLGSPTDHHSSCQGGKPRPPLKRWHNLGKSELSRVGAMAVEDEESSHPKILFLC